MSFRKVKGNQAELKLNGADYILVNADDVNLLKDNKCAKKKDKKL
jgi:hypothetical protein